MRDIKDLQAFWRNNAGQDLMMCTIVGKSGSGYRGIGAKKIIRRDDTSSGYLSGGCLEGDIVRTALDNWDKAPFRQSFTTMSEEDRLMGYQTGCAGIIDILFERLPGTIDRMTDFLPYGKKENIAGVAVSLDSQTLAQRTALYTLPAMRDDKIFIDPWIEPLHLYVIGCGPNARPFADLAPPLGWDVTFLDYRQKNVIERDGITSLVVPVGDIGRHIADGPRSAVILMTHNYEADLEIIAQLNGRKFGYMGSVGPRKRFEQMKTDLPAFHNIEMDQTWAETVKAPAGLKQGRSPEDIAFSIIAEIQFSLGELS